MLFFLIIIMFLTRSLSFSLLSLLLSHYFFSNYTFILYSKKLCKYLKYYIFLHFKIFVYCYLFYLSLTPLLLGFFLISKIFLFYFFLFVLILLTIPLIATKTPIISFFFLYLLPLTIPLIATKNKFVPSFTFIIGLFQFLKFFYFIFFFLCIFLPSIPLIATFIAIFSFFFLRFLFIP